MKKNCCDWVILSHWPPKRRLQKHVHRLLSTNIRKGNHLKQKHAVKSYLYFYVYLLSLLPFRLIDPQTQVTRLRVTILSMLPFLCTNFSRNPLTTSFSSSSSDLLLQFPLATVLQCASHQENKRLFGLILQSLGGRGDSRAVCYIFESNNDGEKVCAGVCVREREEESDFTSPIHTVWIQAHHFEWMHNRKKRRQNKCVVREKIMALNYSQKCFRTISSEHFEPEIKVLIEPITLTKSQLNSYKVSLLINYSVSYIDVGR